MINPNKEYLLTGKVTLNEQDGIINLGAIEAGGHTYKGYDISAKLQIGDLVTFRVQYSITAQEYTIVKGSVRRKRKPKIIVIDRRIDSFGTLYVKFLGHDGQIKEVSFDEGDWESFNRYLK
jgi:hypothetical protein